MDKNETINYEDMSFKVPWGQIAGRWYGNRKARPLLALHGWQDNLGTWDRLIPLLPKHIPVLCVEFPGHGRSSKYPPGVIYHTIDYTHIIGIVVKTFKWSKVSLMGHSMGAVIAFFYAALYPHMVDLLIQIDLVKPINYSPAKQIEKYQTQVESWITENERLKEFCLKEPPSHTFQQLEDILNKGSAKSVQMEFCKHLLKRSIEKSRMFPDKYFFSRDSRIKYHAEASGEQSLALEMARRIKNIAYMLIKSDMITYMAPTDENIVNLLKVNNPHFAFYTLKNSTHHLHLNSAEKVAALINPFILKYRSFSEGNSILEDNLVSKKKSKL